MSAAVRDVLVGARSRLALRFHQDDCVCETTIAAGDSLNYPPAEVGTWCWLCAVESEAKSQGEPAEVHGHALGEVAFDISGVRFTMAEWPARDDVLFGRLWDAGQASVLEAFDATITRLGEAQS
jgi:hypothetical protein